MKPDSIAHYRISSKRGEGAMGEVYRATDSKLGREVAQLPLELLSNQNPGTLADATRDAQRLLLVMPVQENSQRELAVVLNWQAGLRK